MNGWKLVPVEPTEEMLKVLHGRVLISVDSRKREANILNDKAWWSAVVSAAPQPPALGGAAEVLRNRLDAARSRFSRWNERLIDSLRSERAHVARLQVEVERLRGIERSHVLREALLEQIKGERDRMIQRTLELSPEVDRLIDRTAELEGLLREIRGGCIVVSIREKIDAALAEGAKS